MSKKCIFNLISPLGRASWGSKCCLGVAVVRARKRGGGQYLGSLVEARPRPRSTRATLPGQYACICSCISEDVRRRSKQRSPAEAMRCAPYFADVETINHRVGNPGSLTVPRHSLQYMFYCGSNKPSRAHVQQETREGHGQTCETL